MKDDEQWRDLALCAETDPESFFPDKGESTKDAKKICLLCEVRDKCLEDALNTDERFGVRGGYSERERRRLKRGETVTPTMLHGGHQPSAACYRNGCKQPDCRRAASGAA